MSKRRNRSRLKSRAPRERASPQAKAWAAGLAAMGNERWEEATIRLRDTLQRTKDAEIRRGTYYKLKICSRNSGERLRQEVFALTIWTPSWGLT